MSDASAKQQIVDKIKDSTNILVTVSSSPSVDELSAALGLSMLLNKMKKHATAVVSGDIPPAINFLQPEKTFESSVDSLRDFIIALDKEKADHLRYKVEGDVVKIFITPYRTTITSGDLDFSQGDYNVELVLALGVRRQDNLDKALEAHGQILADATVATITAGREKSDLGSIDWHDERASSLSEMAVSLGDALKIDRGFVDEQIATAFLAGIVSATERFSNKLTSARVMTMAAELMKSGANQQLIASKFEEAMEDEEVEQASKVRSETAEPETSAEKPSEASVEEGAVSENSDGTTSLSEGESTKVERGEEPESPQEVSESNASADPEAGTLSISHEKEGTLDEVAWQKAEEDQAAAAAVAEAAAAVAQPVAVAEQELSDQLPTVVTPSPADLSPEDLQRDIEAASAEVQAAAEAPQLQGAVSSDVWKNAPEPTYGGALNATTESAAEEARKADADTRNKTILSHSSGYIADQIPTYEAPINAASQPPEDQTIVNPLHDATSPTAQAAPIEPPTPTLMDIDQQNRAPAIPGLPPLPDFSTLPPMPPAPGMPVGGDEPASDKLGDILPPTEQAPQPAASNDPGQFRIPGQG